LNRIGAVIPALDAGRYLAALLDEIAERQPALCCVVVDDGSADDTAAVAAAHGATVIVHPVNRGKGAALKSGFAYALAEGWDWVFTLDADGQHLPVELADFLAAAATGEWDVLVGDRMAAVEHMPRLRLMTNRFTSRVVSRLCGCRIPDSQNGYRLFRVAALAGVHVAADRYDFESEILVRLARRGARIGSVPTRTVYGDETSSIHPFRDTVRFFRLAWRLRRADEVIP
jgi:glycosyltransferase involved in cell wall biosynthesis